MASQSVRGEWGPKWRQNFSLSDACNINGRMGECLRKWGPISTRT